MALEGFEKLIKRDLPLYLLTVIGIFVVINYYFETPPVYGSTVEYLQTITNLVAAISVGLGLVSLTRVHIRDIRNREPGKWFLSIWLLVLMYGFIIIGILRGSASPIYRTMFDLFLTPTRIGTSSIYGFMVVGAIYVSLKVRNLETLVFGGIMAIRLLARAPVTDALFPFIGPISLWIETGLNVGAGRAWVMAVGVGLIIASFNVIAGRESRALGGGVD